MTRVIDICAVIVMVTSIAAVVRYWGVNPTAAIYAGTTFGWAFIALIRG